MVARFGRVTSANLGPGVHYRWPWPMGRADIEAADEVKRIEIGFRNRIDALADDTSAAQRRDSYRDESWMLTGDEDIIDIKWVVHYQVRQTEDGQGLWDYLYGLGDKEALVRAAAESAIRTAVGSRKIDTLLTTERGHVESVVKNEFLQPALDRCDAGIRVVNVSLLDVHAPPEVHWAFRDVASAAEDKETAINRAGEYSERVVRQAEGDAAKQVLTAEGHATQIVQQSEGQAVAFTEQLRAYQASPAVTKLRLYFESMDAVLGPLRKYVKLSQDAGTRLDLWFLKDREKVQLPQLPPAEAEKQR